MLPKTPGCVHQISGNYRLRRRIKLPIPRFRPYFTKNPA